MHATLDCTRSGPWLARCHSASAPSPIHAGPPAPAAVLAPPSRPQHPDMVSLTHNAALLGWYRPQHRRAPRRQRQRHTQPRHLCQPRNSSNHNNSSRSSRSSSSRSRSSFQPATGGWWPGAAAAASGKWQRWSQSALRRRALERCGRHAKGGGAGGHGADGRDGVVFLAARRAADVLNHLTRTPRVCLIDLHACRVCSSLSGAAAAKPFPAPRRCWCGCWWRASTAAVRRSGRVASSRSQGTGNCRWGLCTGLGRTC